MSEHVRISDLTIPATDGFALAATLFEPTGPRDAADAAPIVMISPATAVSRGYYARFATYLAGRGMTALTYDYRGVGGSRPKKLRGFEARMRDWGERDLAGVIDWITGQYPHRPIHNVGHSAGGFGPGLAANGDKISRQLSIACLSGHWGYMASPEKYRILFLMGLLLPAIARLCGYFPGRIVGQAEDLPKGVMLEWARWCLRPAFMFDDPSLPSKANFAKFRAALRVAIFSDDPWGTEEAVDHLTSHFTNAAREDYWRIVPADVGARKIGHMGFFRDAFRDTLWAEAADWLAEGSIGENVRVTA